MEIELTNRYTDKPLKLEANNIEQITNEPIQFVGSWVHMADGSKSAVQESIGKIRKLVNAAKSEPVVKNAKKSIAK